jgi:hypothetical protein
VSQTAKGTAARGKGGAKAKDAGKGPGPIRLWASRGRAIGGLIGFAVTTFVSWRTGLGLTDSALRGLLGALAFSFVGWWCALMIITGLMRTALRREPKAPPPAEPAP